MDIDFNKLTEKDVEFIFGFPFKFKQDGYLIATNVKEISVLRFLGEKFMNLNEIHKEKLIKIINGEGGKLRLKKIRFFPKPNSNNIMVNDQKFLIMIDNYNIANDLLIKLSTSEVTKVKDLFYYMIAKRLNQAVDKNY